MAGAGFDVDVRIDAALRDESQLRQPVEQRRLDLRALADEHQRFGGLQPLGEALGVLHVVVPHRDVVAGQLPEAVQGAQRVVIVVEDRDLHALPSGSAA